MKKNDIKNNGKLDAQKEITTFLNSMFLPPKLGNEG